MSDPEDPPAPASPPTRSIEASRRLSQLLARPLGAPVPPGETPEPYVPRPERSASPPAPAAEPPHDTASARPPVAPVDEPDLPWFDRLVQPAPAPERVVPPEPSPGDIAADPSVSVEAFAHNEPRDPAPASDDDLFTRRETPRDLDQQAAPAAPNQVPEWAWPSALERAPEPAPEPRAELGAPPEPLAAPESPEPPRRARERPAPEEPAPAAPPVARPEETARTLGNIRRLMLVSNLFMVVAIGAVLTVVGYRLFRSEPAPAPPPAQVAAPAPAKIPVDMTLTLPRGARIIETAVAGERLVITLEIDGATEIRTFDIKTLQPTGRLSFGIVP